MGYAWQTTLWDSIRGYPESYCDGDLVNGDNQLAGHSDRWMGNLVQGLAISRFSVEQDRRPTW